MSNLKRRLNQEIAFEAERGRNMQSSSVISADGVYRIASNSDKVLTTQIQSAFESVEQVNTFENINAQIKNLQSYKDKAFLPSTESVIDNSIQSLQNMLSYKKDRQSKLDKLDSAFSKLDINDQNSLNDYRNKVDDYARENIINSTAYNASMQRFEDEIAEQKRERTDKLVLDFTKNISKYVSQNEVPYRIAELVDKTDDPNVQSVAMNYLNTYNTYINKQLTEATNTADAKKAKLLSDRQKLIEDDKGFHEKIKSNLEVLASQNYNNRAILPAGIKTSADLYNKNYHNKYSGDKDSTIDDYNIQENYKDMTKFLVDYFRSTKSGTSLAKETQQQIENSQISIIQNPNHRLHRVTVNDLIKTLKNNASSRLEGKEDDDGRIAEYNIIMNLSERFDLMHERAYLYEFGDSWGSKDGLDEALLDGVNINSLDVDSPDNLFNSNIITDFELESVPAESTGTGN